jgi:hypothetical protein
MRLAVRTITVIAVVFIASGVPISASNLPNCPTSGHPGFRLSKVSTNLCFQDLNNKYRHLYLPSPDGSVLLIVDGYEGRFVKNGKTLGQLFRVAEDEDIIWSPDSTAMMVTMHLDMDLFSTNLAYTDPKRSPPPDITTLVQKDYASRHPCVTSSQSVAILGLSWQKGSRQAVLVALLPESCSGDDRTDNFDAYVIAIPEGAILAATLKVLRRRNGTKRCCRHRRPLPKILISRAGSTGLQHHLV